uniref:Uncharacterized protein n=1 Tax=Terrapene triunguis TaxID=2587831 RepID=A0A674IMP4_9SAUR
METGCAARTNGVAGNQEDVTCPSPSKKQGEELKKSTSPSGGEKEAAKSTSSPSLETGKLKSSIYSGTDWKRPIIQFVESDEKKSSYFSMDSGDGKKLSYPGVQLGDVTEGGEVLPGVPGFLLRAAPQAPSGGGCFPGSPAAGPHQGL